MNVRPASFRDLARIEQLYAEASGGADRAPQIPTDHPVPQATLLRLWYAVSKTVSSLVPFTAGTTGDTLLVAETAREGIVGFIQAQAPPGKAGTLQILNLCVTGTATGHFAREQLLTQLTNHGAERGIHRFLVRLPLDDPLVGLFLERGFVQVATEQILYSDDVPPPRAGGRLALRPARREDIGSLYLLYLRTTPSHVASLEGTSLKSWQAGFADGTMTRIGRDDARHLVLEDPGVVGWAAIRPASAVRPTLLSLMCDGHVPQLREALVDGALRELPPGPVTSVLRHYDSELIRTLQQRGFAIYGTQLLLVRDLASRVRLRTVPARKKPVLIHAHLARSMPADAPTLRVLSRGGERSPRP
jgi:hypothetical protein